MDSPVDPYADHSRDNFNNDPVSLLEQAFKGFLVLVLLESGIHMPLPWHTTRNPVT